MSKETDQLLEANVDQAELDKFQSLAKRWWDPNSEFKPLHDINPLRIGYISERCQLIEASVLDVGCGGGILTEALATAGAQVTGIDLADKPLSVARLHLHESGLTEQIDYRQISAESLAAECPASYDVITCLEMLEHVPDPASTIQALSKLIKPGGQIFLSTINRNPKSWLLMVVGAEYVLNMLPRGTHDYAKFIKPSELSGMLRSASLSVSDITGMTYNPVSRRYRLGQDIDVNYVVHAQAPQ